MKGILNHPHGVMEGIQLTSVWSHGFKRWPHQLHTPLHV